jgi:chromosome partitioning protein
MTKTICLFNHKGGVSKTTTTFNLGWALARLGKKVLLVDLDDLAPHLSAPLTP